MKNKLTGFTLAEVLITLLITGIVASLVIPTIINDTQKQEWVIGLKKSVSDFNQAYKMWQIDIGTTDFANNIPSNNGLFLNEFVKYLDVIKVCPAHQNPGECFCQDAKYMDGHKMSDLIGSINGFTRAILKDGRFIMTYGYHQDCIWTKNVTNGTGDACTQIFVDVNGMKGPNVMGRDIFATVFTRKNGVLPTGIQGSVSSCNGIFGYYDEGCAGKIAREGWKMNY